MGGQDNAAGQIDHLAFAVEDLDVAVDLFNKLLGIEPAWRGESEDHDVRVALFRVGDVKLELLEGMGSESTIGRFIEKRGSGFHHICFAVEDLKATLERLRLEGFEVVGSGEEVGVEGRPVAFVHPSSSGGILIEFIEGSERGEE
jgi:methylmalonyl-CoA/ethylmalonyl-CoA epimerase